MRPTIPLADWRLAIDLDATRALNALDTLPARGCACQDCRGWAAAEARSLPFSLRAELVRIGIEPARPSDIYVLDRTADREHYRVSYHCVGRIVSGPPMFVESPDSGSGQRYELVRAAPDAVAVAVAYQEALGALPEWAPGDLQPLLAIDLFVAVRRAHDQLERPGKRSHRQAAG